MKDIKTPESTLMCQSSNLIREPTCAKNAFVLALIVVSTKSTYIIDLNIFDHF